MQPRSNIICMTLCFLLLSCASKELKHAKGIDKKIDEYDKLVKVKELPPPPEINQPVVIAAKVDETKKSKDEAKAQAEAVKKAELEKAKEDKKSKKVKMEKRLPELEDSEGFNGRRPIVDPFRVGEKVTLAVTYLNMAAGYMTLEVKPFVEVNNKKAYSFYGSVKSSSVFSMFYSVDDWTETFLDYQELVPYTLSIHVKESKQLKEIRTYFDWKNKKGQYWEKKITADKGEQNKKMEWKVEPYTQNIISAFYYIRAFTLTPGKKLKFKVADDGKNIMVNLEVVRREVLKTEIGDLKTVVVKPKFEVNGFYKQVGDIFIWYTDDDHKYMVRFEAKVKIGTLVGKLKSIE